MKKGVGLGRYPEYWAAYNVCWKYRASIYVRGHQWEDLIVDVYIKLLEWNSYDPTKGNVWTYHYFGARWVIFAWIYHRDSVKRNCLNTDCPRMRCLTQHLK